MNFIEIFLKNLVISAIISTNSTEPLIQAGISFNPLGSTRVGMVTDLPISDFYIEKCLVSIGETEINFSGGNSSGNLFEKKEFTELFNPDQISNAHSFVEYYETAEYKATFVFGKKGMTETIVIKIDYK